MNKLYWRIKNSSEGQYLISVVGGILLILIIGVCFTLSRGSKKDSDVNKDGVPLVMNETYITKEQLSSGDTLVDSNNTGYGYSTDNDIGLDESGTTDDKEFSNKTTIGTNKSTGKSSEDMTINDTQSSTTSEATTTAAIIKATKSVPAVSSGWKDDIAYELMYYNKTPNTNNHDETSQDCIMTAEYYNRLNSVCDEWVNGVYSKDNILQRLCEERFRWEDQTEGSWGFYIGEEDDAWYFAKALILTASGCDANTITELKRQLDTYEKDIFFHYAKVYYDAPSNICKLWYLCGGINNE